MSKHENVSKNEHLKILYGIIHPELRYKQYVIKPPSNKVIAESFILAESLENDITYGGMITREEMKKIMVRREIITETVDKDLEKMNDMVEKKRLEAYTNRLNPKIRDLAKKAISTLKNTINKMNSEIYQFDASTREGNVEYIRQHFLVLESIYKNGKKVRIKDGNLADNIIFFVQSNKLSSDDIRQASKLEEWKTIWNSGKGNPFGGSTANLTDEQRTLILYTKMYDNAAKHSEPPEEGVFNDDDLFDGWMIYQRKKAEKERKNKSVGDQFGDAEFVSLPANSIEEVQSIQAMNDESMRTLNRSREQYIKEKGKVRYADLPDVKYDAFMEAQKQKK